MINSKRPIPIGVSDFKEIRENNYCYIDKTLFISHILEHGSKVILYTRPRRFGKTLNLSMLQCFLNYNSESAKPLFKGLKIEKERSDLCKKYMNQVPVFSITLKNLEFVDYENFAANFNERVAEQYENFKYLLDSKFISKYQKETFIRIISRKATKIDLKVSLKFITTILHAHHKIKPFLLIDEYDAPIHSAFNYGQYEQCIAFMKGLLGESLKDNLNLNKAIMTGILRLAKESIFSDLNHLNVMTVLEAQGAQFFGLTQKEVEDLVQTYELTKELPKLKNWYNGYQFGNCEGVYNPWSILKWIDDPTHSYVAHWLNTSSNNLVRSLFFEYAHELEEDIEKLLCGENIQIQLKENLHFPTLQTNCSTNDYFSLLVHSGYLSLKNNLPLKNRWYTIGIPNEEIKEIFAEIIEEWLKQITPNLKNNLSLIISDALKNRDLKTFEVHFTDVVLQVMSYHDFAKQPENAFHCFTAGFLSWLSDEYYIKSNREAGLGRADICLIPINPKLPGYIFELKVYKTSKKMKTIAKTTIAKQLNIALEQIEEQKYAAEFKAHKIKNITKVAMVFYGKNVWFKTKS